MRPGQNIYATNKPLPKLCNHSLKALIFRKEWTHDHDFGFDEIYSLTAAPWDLKATQELSHAHATDPGTKVLSLTYLLSQAQVKIEQSTDCRPAKNALS